MPWGATSWGRAGSLSCPPPRLSSAGAKPGTFCDGLMHLLCNSFWAKHALLPPVVCLQTSLVWTYTCLTNSEEWWISAVHMVIFLVWAVHNNKLDKVSSALCGMSLTLCASEVAPGFSWRHYTGGSYLSNGWLLNPNPPLALFPTGRISVCREVMGFISLGHDFALGRAGFHPFFCSVILRGTSCMSCPLPSLQQWWHLANLKQNVPAFCAEVIREHIKWGPRMILDKFSAFYLINTAVFVLIEKLLRAPTSCSAILPLARPIAVSSENWMWLSCAWIRGQ